MSTLARRTASAVYLIAALIVGLGALGYGSNTPKLAAALAQSPAFEAADVRVILAVWVFVSGCMAVFGLILGWTWWRWRNGERRHFFASDMIGLFYAINGVASVLYSGLAFFWLFLALGAALLICGFVLRRSA
ncbi:MAG TPA: hypothetical protein VF132_05120 [Rudaea sp.]